MNLCSIIFEGTSFYRTALWSEAVIDDDLEFLLTTENERDEEDRDSYVVLYAFHIEIRSEALNFRITNVGLVDVGHKVEKDEHGHEMPLSRLLVSRRQEIYHNGGKIGTYIDLSNNSLFLVVWEVGNEVEIFLG